MLISQELADAFNEQIGHEFGASLQYVSIAGHFDRQRLKLLSKLFFDQAEEEKLHALKFVRYVLDTHGHLQIPSIPAPVATFASAEAYLQAVDDLFEATRACETLRAKRDAAQATIEFWRSRNANERAAERGFASAR